MNCFELGALGWCVVGMVGWCVGGDGGMVCGWGWWDGVWMGMVGWCVDGDGGVGRKQTMKDRMCL